MSKDLRMFSYQFVQWLLMSLDITPCNLKDVINKIVLSNENNPGKLCKNSIMKCWDQTQPWKFESKYIFPIQNLQGLDWWSWVVWSNLESRLKLNKEHIWTIAKKSAMTKINWG